LAASQLAVEILAWTAKPRHNGAIECGAMPQIGNDSISDFLSKGFLTGTINENTTFQACAFAFSFSRASRSVVRRGIVRR
jgi:hypothetical protein